MIDNDFPFTRYPGGSIPVRIRRSLELTQEVPREKLPDLRLVDAKQIHLVCDDEGPVVLVFQEAA